MVTSPCWEAASLFEGTGAVVVTGGLGALGLLTASWLLKRGMRHIHLVGSKVCIYPCNVAHQAEDTKLVKRLFEPKEA